MHNIFKRVTLGLVDMLMCYLGQMILATHIKIRKAHSVSYGPSLRLERLQWQKVIMLAEGVAHN